MTSTSQPPFCPPPRPDDPQNERSPRASNVVPLHRSQGEGAVGPLDGDEPAWRRAFALAEGVMPPRTPAKVIRARHGYPEPEPAPAATISPVAAQPATEQEPSSPLEQSAHPAACEPAVR